jgi:hypothetical protein
LPILIRQSSHPLLNPLDPYTTVVLFGFGDSIHWRSKPLSNYIGHARQRNQAGSCNKGVSLPDADFSIQLESIFDFTYLWTCFDKG